MKRWVFPPFFIKSKHFKPSIYLSENKTNNNIKNRVKIMAINFDGLTSYVDEQRFPLIKKAVLGAKSVGIINLQSGVKKSAALNLINVEPTIQAGGCGWNAEGVATLSQRVLETELLKVNIPFCDKDFINYWTNYEVKVGAGRETLPFEEYFTSSVIENVNAKIERMVWQGRKENSGEFNGILAVLEGTDAVSVESVASAYGAIKAVYEAIPVEVLPKASIFVGADTFRSFMLEMVEKNYFHYSADAVEEFILPGTNTKVIAVNGLNGTKKVIAADPMNLFYGCDMLDDAETFDLWYSKDNREYRLAVQFNAGTQVAYPNEVVIGGRQ